MSNIDKLVENYFINKKEVLSPNKFFKMIEEQMEELAPKNRLVEAKKKTKEKPKSIVDLMPKLQISEDWGVVGSESRKIFEKYMDGIKGAGLPDKIASINNFLEGIGKEQASVSDILSNLVFLELLATVLEQFSPSGAGFLFEAFLAGMLRGTQVTEKVAGELPIEDIRIFIDPATGSGGRAVSLKLLSADTLVSGSITNLLRFLAFQDKENKGIEYVVAVKFKDKVLAFYSFVINKTNVLEWIGNYFYKPKLDEAINKNIEKLLLREQEDEEEQDPLEQKYRSAQKEFNYLSQAAGMRNGVSPRGRGARDRSVEIAKSAPIEVLRKFSQYAKDAGLEDSEVAERLHIQYEGTPWHKEGLDWLATVKSRRKLLKWLQTNLSPKHPMGLPYTYQHKWSRSELEVWDPEAREYTPSEAGQKLNDIAQTDPARWFKIMNSAARVNQFHIDAKYYKTKNLPPSMLAKRYGDIRLAKDEIRAAAEKYNEQLKDVVIPLYEALNSFNKSLTEYYLDHNLEAAPKAAESAGILKTRSEQLATEATQK